MKKEELVVAPMCLLEELVLFRELYHACDVCGDAFQGVRVLFDDLTGQLVRLKSAASTKEELSSSRRDSDVSSEAEWWRCSLAGWWPQFLTLDRINSVR